jgi:hypothetical protein
MTVSPPHQTAPHRGPLSPLNSGQLLRLIVTRAALFTAVMFAGAGTSPWHWQRADSDFGVPVARGAGSWGPRCTRDRCLLMLPTPLAGGDEPGA